MGGAAMVGMTGVGIYFESMSTGREYGQGAAIARGVGYSVPYLGIAMMGYDVFKMAGNAAWDYQKNQRVSSFSRGQVPDLLGTRATMRQRSQQSLGRGRASLGSEARLFH